MTSRHATACGGRSRRSSATSLKGCSFAFATTRECYADLNYVFAGSTYTTLGEWQAATGVDANSAECNPSFINLGAGNLHLQPTDNCAIDKGGDISLITNRDIDGDIRPQGLGFDIGADEAG